MVKIGDLVSSPVRTAKGGGLNLEKALFSERPRDVFRPEPGLDDILNADSPLKIHRPSESSELSLVKKRNSASKPTQGEVNQRLNQMMKAYTKR